MLNAPVIGKSTIGSNAVTAMGSASVIHQAAIQRVDARIALASSDIRLCCHDIREIQDDTLAGLFGATGDKILGPHIGSSGGSGAAAHKKMISGQG